MDYRKRLKAVEIVHHLNTFGGGVIFTVHASPGFAQTATRALTRSLSPACLRPRQFGEGNLFPLFFV